MSEWSKESFAAFADEYEEARNHVAATDFTSHHIEGYARAAQERGQHGHFSVPLISHVEGNLWQGGCIGGVRLTDDFKYVVSLYPWEKYTLPDGCERHEFEMYDSGDVPESDQLHEIADLVARCMTDGQTLVHCQAGLNRSGLVAGLALVLAGRTPQDAIDLLREKRCDMVLCNGHFEHWLLNAANPHKEQA